MSTVPPKHAVAYAKTIAAAIKNAKPVEVMVVITAADGTRHMQHELFWPDRDVQMSDAKAANEQK